MTRNPAPTARQIADQANHDGLYKALVADGHNVSLWADDPAGLRAYVEAIGWVEVRTYEHFDIVWDRGSRWTSYDTAEECEKILASAASHNGGTGHVERKTFSVTIDEDSRFLYQPGIRA